MESDLSRVFRAMWWRSAMAVDDPSSDLATTFWCAQVSALRFRSVAIDDWTVDPTATKPPLHDLGTVLFHVTEHHRVEQAVLGLAGALVHLRRNQRGRIDVTIAAAEDDAVATALAHLKQALPKQEPRGTRVTMKFWSCPRAASYREETVDVCAWDAIAGNYGARTRSELSPLMNPAAAQDNGKLLLWLGPPGTGKTYALRALAWEQREKVAVHYILDPDVFLSRVDYVMSVFRDDDDDDDELPGAKKSRLIVLEDAGELLGADAMSRTGQGLGRLLNLTDGLPGQATRTRVLITTNEEVGRLHPAVTRPGRCGALVRFTLLDPTEAAAWWRAQDRTPPDRETTSAIASLFAELRGERGLDAPRRSVGFIAPAPATS